MAVQFIKEHLSIPKEIFVNGVCVNAKVNFVMQSENHATVPYFILSIGAPQAQPVGLLDQLRALIHRQFEYDHVSAVDALETALVRRQWHVIIYDFDTFMVDRARHPAPDAADAAENSGHRRRADGSG